MKFSFLLLLFFCIAATESYHQKPAVLICVLVRNKAAILPYFLTYLEQLDYPKDRIGLWIRSDYNEDRTIIVLDTWLNATQSEYHVVNKKYKISITKRAQENSATDWPTERLAHITAMKEEALKYARDSWFDYIFFLDADVILTNSESLTKMMDAKLPIVSPLLQSDEGYTNFWTSIENEVKQNINDEHEQILNSNENHEIECGANAILINLNLVKSDLLTFEKKVLNSKHKYSGPLDPDLFFCISAKVNNIPIQMLNYQKHRIEPVKFGYVMPPTTSIEAEKQSLTNILLDIVQRTKGKLLKVRPNLENFLQYPKPDKFGFSRVYAINLDRRTDLREYYEQQYKILGLDVERFPAIDAQNLTQLDLNNLGIKILDNYLDPYHKRSIKLGEIGCFLSHYNIWKQMVELNLSIALITEDDLRVFSNFKEKTLSLLKTLKELKDWDLVYLSRKWVKGTETSVREAHNLVHVSYSYWTIAYALTLDGAKKLLAAKPLEKLLPVDEFLPIMYGKHPNQEWNKHFPKRNLKALAANPSLAEPLYYTKDKGYISETEMSGVTQ